MLDTYLNKKICVMNLIPLSDTFFLILGTSILPKGIVKFTETPRANRQLGSV